MVVIKKKPLIVFCILFLSGLITSTLFIDLPKHPVRDFATMTISLDPYESEFVRLKIPWGYLAPNLSYLPSEPQSSIFLRAEVMMFLMGLSEIDIRKQQVENPREKTYTHGFSFNALFPNFESKNLENISGFISNNEGSENVISITVVSSSKSKYWNDNKNGILSSYGVDRDSIERKLNNSKTFKAYGFQLEQLPPQYGLSRLGLSNANVQKMRNDNILEVTIPNDLWEYRSNEGDLISYIKCMKPDIGLICSHTMHVASINSKVQLSYHPRLLKDWQVIEKNIRQLFKKFIDLGKE